METREMKPMTLEIKEGNKLIIESPFVSNVHKKWLEKWNADQERYALPDDNFYERLLYHSSWDWLMPSWKKVYDRLQQMNTSACWVYVNEMRNALIDADVNRAWVNLVASIKFINE